MKTEEPTTELILSEDQENEQVQRIASASLTNIRENRKKLEELATTYKDITINGIDDKANYKTVSAGITATRSARAAVAKLTKNEKGYLKKAAEMLDTESELLIAIVSPVENALKAEKERIDTLKEEAEQERLRLIEEQKQARIATLFKLGMKFNGAYYEIGELNLTSLQVTQYSEAQFEGFVTQAKVMYEAEQLRIAEEEEKLEQQRKSDEAEALKLKQENEAHQTALNNQNALMQEIIAERTESRIKDLKSRSFVEVKLRNCWEYRDFIVGNNFIETATKVDFDAKVVAFEVWLADFNKPKIAQLNILPTPVLIKATQNFNEQQEDALNDVLVAEECVKADWSEVDVSCTAHTTFTQDKPFIDTMIGKSTFRIYMEHFLDEAQEGLTKEMVAASGSISDDLLFLVIKGK